MDNNLYIIVKKDIENKIIAGELKAGDKIPTLAELEVIYNVGRSTAQKAITALSDDGTIVKRVREGCFVKPFVRERLAVKAKTDFELKLNELIEEAKIIGIEKNAIIEIIDNNFEAVL